jgi:hypothetical protein
MMQPAGWLASFDLELPVTVQSDSSACQVLSVRLDLSG